MHYSDVQQKNSKFQNSLRRELTLVPEVFSLSEAPKARMSGEAKPNATSARRKTIRWLLQGLQLLLLRRLQNQNSNTWITALC